jgi:opacity protein-like surface antigen
MSVRVATAARLWATAGEKQFSGDNMKKLISVFAAMALVGSLAAQKKPAAKAPAKPAAPAAPAVAAPAAPAIAAPAAVPAAPAAGASSKGMGLFVEGRGSFTLAHGTSDSGATGDVSAATVEYKLANSNGFGGGATIGYDIVDGLGLVASFDYRSITTRKFETTNNSAPVPGVTYDRSAQQKTNTMVLGLGIRPQLKALGGLVYAGAGFAYVLPFDDVTTIDITNSSSPLFAVTKQEITKSWNAGIGAYGELGYNYNITDNIYVGLGVRLLVATANNDGKTEVTKTTGTVLGNPVPDQTTEYSATVTGSKQEFESSGITDMSATISVGFRL